jgi:hypothetical protein
MVLNGHNVQRSEGGHDTYGIHAFRNPEINAMFKAIESCASMEKEITSLKDKLQHSDEKLMHLSSFTGTHICDNFSFSGHELCDELKKKALEITSLKEELDFIKTIKDSQASLISKIHAENLQIKTELEIHKKISDSAEVKRIIHEN